MSNHKCIYLSSSFIPPKKEEGEKEVERECSVCHVEVRMQESEEGNRSNEEVGEVRLVVASVAGGRHGT